MSTCCHSVTATHHSTDTIEHRGHSSSPLCLCGHPSTDFPTSESTPNSSRHNNDPSIISRPSRTPSLGSPATCFPQSCSNTYSASSTYQKQGHTSQHDVEVLACVLPDVPRAQLKFLLEISNGDSDAVINYILEGLSPSCLVKLLKDFYIEECNVRKVTLEEYGDIAILAEEAIAFNKSPHAELRISIEDQPAVDVGGVRKQFMSDVLNFFTSSNAMRLFEGISPVFNIFWYATTCWKNDRPQYRHGRPGISFSLTS